MLKVEYSNYQDPSQKIKNLVKKGLLFKLTKGLYETNKSTSGYVLACAINNPSYLSFEFALRYYGFIPEEVYVFTSATFKKKKKKEYRNYFGTYLYQDVPSRVFYLGVDIKEENGFQFLIAIPEKALCDMLYKLKPVKNQKELIYLLFDDLRIDEDMFWELDKESLMSLCDLYGCTNLKLLKKVVERNDFSTTVND